MKTMFDREKKLFKSFDIIDSCNKPDISKKCKEILSHMIDMPEKIDHEKRCITFQYTSRELPEGDYEGMQRNLIFKIYKNKINSIDDIYFFTEGKRGGIKKTCSSTMIDRNITIGAAISKVYNYHDGRL
jgi:hypothetical protein